MEGLMFDKLRGKKSPLDLKPGQPIWAIDPTIEDVAVNFNTVIEYLTGLSDEDYVKVMDVAGIYRKGEKDVAAVMGMPLEPTTFITPPDEPPTPGNTSMADQYASKEHNPNAQTLLDGDDDISAAFLTDDEQPPKKKTSKTLEVKSDDK